VLRETGRRNPIGLRPETGVFSLSRNAGTAPLRAGKAPGTLHNSPNEADPTRSPGGSMSASHLVIRIAAWAAVAWAAAVIAWYLVSYRRFKRSIRKALLRLARGDDLVLHIASGDARLLREIARVLVPPRRTRRAAAGGLAAVPPVRADALRVVVKDLSAHS
jgi:hypothetical protein